MSKSLSTGQRLSGSTSCRGAENARITYIRVRHHPEQTATGHESTHGTHPKNLPGNLDRNGADGEPGLNYLCAGYRKFFKHVAPYMDFMKQELMNQRPPANIMDAIREGRFN